MISVYTRDRVFGVMLQAALEEFVPCEVKECPPASHESGIVDLDSFPSPVGGQPSTGGLPSAGGQSSVDGQSSGRECFSDGTAEEPVRLSFSKNPFAGADLLRPFLTEDFLFLCRQRFPAWFAEAFPEGEPFGRRTADSQKAAAFRREGERFFYRGEELSFSPTEKKLFSLLFEAGGEAVSSDRLQTALASGEGLTVYIHALRKKLDFRFGCRLILTVRGRGYRLARNHPEKGQ